MKITINKTPAPAAVIPWPVGTVALVRLKNGKKNREGFLRYHAVVGEPSGANVDSDDPSTLKNVRHVAVNLATGSAKGTDAYSIDKYEVLAQVDASIVANVLT